MNNPIAGVSPDRKMAWFLILTGTIKLFDLDKWIPMPEDPEQVIQVIGHANQQVQDLVEQLRRVKEPVEDGSVTGMLLSLGGGLYIIGKKAKEVMAIYKRGITLQVEASDDPQKM